MPLILRESRRGTTNITRGAVVPFHQTRGTSTHGPPGVKTATDRTKTWFVRVCFRCQKDNPGNMIAVYSGKSSGGLRKRAAAADPPVEDEQPNFSTSQLVPWICNHLETPIQLSLHTYEAQTKSKNTCVCPPLFSEPLKSVTQ